MRKNIEYSLGLQKSILVIAIGLIFGLSACSGQSQDGSGGKLSVVATTTIVADVVRQIGGDMIILDVLLPVGTDPHTFTPTPQDLAKISQADLLFMNGMGLETFLETYLENATEDAYLVEVSEGGKVLETSTGHELGGTDPHTWTDPGNVQVWVENIKDALSELDPSNAESYHANAESYQSRLDELDAWIVSMVAQIPPEKRKIVTDHEAFAYFAQRYGFTQIGTIIPGTSTLSEPSAEDMAALEDLIRTENVRAIFVDTAANPMLAERISGDTGVKIELIYSASLTEVGGEAGSYIDYMRYNVTTFVEALK